MSFPLASFRKFIRSTTSLARSPIAQVLLWSAVAFVLTVGARTSWRLRESVALTRLSEALKRVPDRPCMRLLIIGDSTAVGTGASAPEASLADLLAQEFPRLLIDNRARDGARFAELLAQLDGAEYFDMVLIQAGGNDVIRLRDLEGLRSYVGRVTDRASQRAALVVLMPAGNVGNAPLFFAPLSWLMTWRARRLHAFVREAASYHAAVYVNLFHDRDEDPFVQRPELNAAGGLHPSDAGYRLWFGELLVQAGLERLLCASPTGTDR